MTTTSTGGSCRRHETSARRNSPLRFLVVMTIVAVMPFLCPLLRLVPALLQTQVNSAPALMEK